MPTVQPLPIDSVADQLRNALSENRAAILAAEPGAGKTTRVPLILRDEPWLVGKKILMLEPRRLAARRAAEFMSSQVGEDVGASIGYRIRGESRTGPKTRVEVVTEGILTRMLHESPDLPGIGLVIFDEFHERSIHADVGLAFTLDVQSHLRGEQEVKTLLANYDPKSQRLMQALRKIFRKRFPSANELVYDYGKSVVISYSPNERGIDSVMTISAAVDGVRLWFSSSLPDPQKVLLGSAKMVRYVPVESAKTLARPEIEALLREVTERAKTVLPRSGSGALVIKQSSAKRRAAKR